ncbi:MAG: hypothetical protein ACRCX2_27055, partial [Paraclostridium sp.]
EATVTLNSNLFILNCKYDNFVVGSDNSPLVKVYNLTDTTKSPVIKVLEPVAEDYMDGKYIDQTMLVIDNSNEQSFDSSIENSIKIVYTMLEEDSGGGGDDGGTGGNTGGGNGYFDGDVKTTPKNITEERFFTVGKTGIELKAPVSSINSISVLDTNQELSNMRDRYILEQSGEIGSSDEIAVIEIVNCDDYPNGEDLAIEYIANTTISDVSFSLNEDYNRIITADILVKKAEQIPVNVQFSVKMTNKYKLADIEYIKSKIKSSVVDFFDNYKMGDNVEQSDLVGWLYADKNVNDAIQYISLPFDVFYIPQNIDEDIPDDGTQVVPDGVLDIDAIQYPILNSQKFKINIIV